METLEECSSSEGEMYIYHCFFAPGKLWKAKARKYGYVQYVITFVVLRPVAQLYGQVRTDWNQCFLTSESSKLLIRDFQNFFSKILQNF